jgi:uncharacterized membrane protein
LGEINKQITVDAPVKMVYAFVSDARNAPKYISSIKRVISGPEGGPAPGQVWRAEANFMGQDRLLNLRVAELVPNKLVRFALDGDPEAVVQLRLTQQESTQSTHVALSLEAVGIPSILLGAVLGGLLSQDMLRLKRLLEHRRSAE